MAKQRQTAKKRAVKAAAPKKPAKRASSKVSTKSLVRKPAAKSAAKSVRGAATPSGTRRRQRVAVSHYREEDFVADSHRVYARLRDLGVAAATGGLAGAKVIRLIGPCDPKEVSKLHYHDAEFQLIYVLNGWVKCYIDGPGEVTMRQGSCWTQPPRNRHLIRDYSDNCELLEVILPAEHKTVEVRG